jgi:formylglycine-generating enzyme required for sulfatase activity
MRDFLRGGGAGVLLVVLAGLALAEPPAKPEEHTNTLGMKLVRIAAGEFLMGSPDAEAERSEAEKLHRVRITRPYWLGKHEVTRGQFRKFVEATQYKTTLEQEAKPGFGFDAATKSIEILPKFNWRETGYELNDEHPVFNVSWNDANAFCDWLSRIEKKKYRLPTEAEWEYACRAGTTTPFFTGESEASLRPAANMADAAFLSKYTSATWSGDWNDGFAFTAPVGSYASNPWGLHDMAGNVWEWCADYYAAELPTKPALAIDPAGPQQGEKHMVRGGAFTNRGKYLRSADRDCDRPKYRYNFTGLRVVCEIE